MVDNDIARLVQRRFRNTVKQYNLINQGDRVLVGLSGGKDSLSLVEQLALFKRSISIEVVALHVALSHRAYSVDTDYLRDFCESRGIQFVLKNVVFEQDKDQKRNFCFMCSWTRRKEMFATAKELSCSKLALGHNMDDVLETLLMNMTFQGSISTIPPLLKMSKFDLSIIRPLCQIEESIIAEYANINDFVCKQTKCPYEKSSNRDEMKQLLLKLKDLNPNLYGSLWHSMENIMPDYLP